MYFCDDKMIFSLRVMALYIKFKTIALIKIEIFCIIIKVFTIKKINLMHPYLTIV